LLLHLQPRLKKWDSNIDYLKGESLIKYKFLTDYGQEFFEILK